MLRYVLPEVRRAVWAWVEIAERTQEVLDARATHVSEADVCFILEQRAAPLPERARSLRGLRQRNREDE